MHPDPNLLSVTDLHVHYGEVCALRDVNFTVSSGTALGLIGRNGAGKSTLLKALAGLINRPAGTITWKGNSLSPEIRRREFAYLPQREEIAWNFPLTVRGLVEMGLYPVLGPWKPMKRIHREAIEQAIAAMDLSNLADRGIAELSGGQQQRAFLARALAGGAKVFLLDEPFAGLDTEGSAKLRERIRKLAESGALILASHHDIGTANKIFDEILLLHTVPLAYGPPDQALTPERLQRAFQ